MFHSAPGQELRSDERLEVHFQLLLLLLVELKGCRRQNLAQMMLATSTSLAVEVEAVEEV